jgi:hypothetical protein
MVKALLDRGTDQIKLISGIIVKNQSYTCAFQLDQQPPEVHKEVMNYKERQRCCCNYMSAKSLTSGTLDVHTIKILENMSVSCCCIY